MNFFSMQNNEDHEQKISKFLGLSNINLIYVIVFLFVLVSLLIWIFSRDFWLNLLSEAIWTVFTVVLLDNLINHSNKIKWKIVKDEIDYLISRNINRLRENVLSRLFDFDPDLEDESKDTDTIEKIIRQQRDKKLQELTKIDPQLLLKSLDKKFSDKENIIYFDERSAEIWQYLDMRHSEYLSPDVVHCLIDLYVNIKDLCSHMRIYNRWKLFFRKNTYYIEIATEWIVFNTKNIIALLIKLKKYWYSEPAKRG